MHPYDFIIVSAYSLAPAALAGVVRFYRTDAVFNPFIYLLWLGIANEIYSSVVINRGDSNAFNNNIYVLGEALLLLWQFYKWEVLKRHRWIYVLPGVAVLAGWGLDNVWPGDIHVPEKLSRMYICAMVLVLAIVKLVQLPKEVKGKHYRIACTIACAGLVLYNAMNVYLEFLFHAFGTAPWRGHLFWWGGWANIIANFLFFIAVLWIPRKVFRLPT
ncbi:MAG: hypothetical protein EOP51_23345 [Sphingobacteriales bacterium]|nr:MAG: hypothetical protein EOP51_23345 [Sphingobacteriales bacterium]